MTAKQTKWNDFVHRYANRLLVFLMLAVPIALLVFFRQNDLKEISRLADENLAFMRTVCQRYDNYALGERTENLSDILYKADALAGMADTDDLHSSAYLQNFLEAQNLTGVVVTDDALAPVSRLDTTGADAYALWEDFLKSESKREILKHRSKTYAGTVTVDGQEYLAAVVSRRDAKGLILCYTVMEHVSTDIYGTSLEKTLENNTFHKNPSIVITDGEQVLASNAAEPQAGTAVTDCPICETGTEVWDADTLTRLHWGGTTWYGKRLAYENYYIYAFYPHGEVFSNMPLIISVAVAIYAIVCLLLLFMRYASEVKFRHRDRRQLNTIHAISSLFISTSILHLDSNTIEGITSTPRAQAILDETTDAQSVAKLLSERVIAPEYSAMYKDFLDFSTMPERLRGKTSISDICRDVSGKWFAIYLIPMEYAPDGSPRHVLFASRDINDFMQSEKEYQEKLRRAARDAETANAAKTSFLRRMSHDLRTPINGIRGMAAMAEQVPGTPEKAREYMDKILASSEYLQTILEDVLRMSKLESGKIAQEKRPFDLQKIIDDTAEFIQERADESGVHCEITTEALPHTKVVGSPLHLRQVMQNVLSNAVKFTPAGGTIHAVCREAACDGKTMQFEFVCTDTGIGMTEEFQSHIFEPFTQEDETARSAFVGTGLGLPIAKEILDLYGGTITVESAKGKGSTFTVHLPLQLDETQRPLPPQEEKASIEGVRILIAEDNDINMEIAHYMLESRGAVITEAANGLEAVEKFRASAPGSFDVVLMDIMMPEMDGLAAARTIRAMDRPDAKTLPIFAMTANAFVDDINLSIGAGMNEHLSKPLNIDDVVAVICRYCRGK